MDTIKVLKKSIRDYKLPSILTPIFIIGEVVLETLIPTVMAVLIDEISTAPAAWASGWPPFWRSTARPRNNSF